MNVHGILKYIALLGVLAIWPFLLGNLFLTHIGFMICLYATMALSMNLMLRIGQLSFAHGALLGLGSYGSALLMMRLGLPFPVAVFGAALIVTLIAWLVGQLFLSVQGVYFVLLTFAFGEIIVLTFVEWVSLFGGSNGLAGVPNPDWFGLNIQKRDGFYLLALALAAFSYASVSALYRSELGAVITSLDENEPLTRSLGINPLQYRLLTFCFSAFLMGLSGALYGPYLTIVTPEDYGFWVPVNLVIINVIGGVAHPIGSVLGALLLVPLPEFLRDAKQYQVIFYGLSLMVFLLFMPNGLYGLINKAWGSKRGNV